jgi:hypothetical protein
VPTNPSGNAIIRDCSENINDQMTLTMTAYPKDNYVFSHWRSLIGKSLDDAGKLMIETAKCPCEGSTSPVCPVSYQNIGLYTDTHSVDSATCMPIAVPAAVDGGGVNTDAPSPM